MSYLKCFFIFQAIILFLPIFTAHNNFNPTNFKEKIWESKLPQQPHPQIIFHLYHTGLSLELLSLQDLSDFLPVNWQLWSEAEKTAALVQIKKICKLETNRALAGRDFGNPSAIFHPRLYQSYRDQGETDPSRIFMLKYLDIISTLDERKIQAILKYGINISNPRALNFVDLTAVYPEISKKLIEEVQLSIPTAIRIQESFLEALKEREKERKQAISAVSSLAKEARKPNVPFATDLIALLS